MFGRKHQNRWGYLFIAPAVVGLVLFSLGPMFISLVISFYRWDLVTKPTFAGFRNYQEAFSDPLVWHSLRVTLCYSLLTVPLITFVPLLAASLLNTRIRGIAVFRTLFYIPSIVPIAANCIIWKYIYDPIYGPLNALLRVMHLPTGKYINSVSGVLPSLALFALWLSGNTVVIYLARMQDLPQDLYEAAALDGAGRAARFFHLTCPLLSSIIFYNLVMAILSCMQTFSQIFIMTEGGPANGSLMYTMLVYNNAFKQSRMGYSSAMSWILFVLMGLITLAVFGSSRFWVYEGNEASR